MNTVLILLGKFIHAFSLAFNLGNGTTWPGHIALQCNKHFIQDLLKGAKTKVILVAGTNGKTTTSLLLKTILEQNNKKVILNASGANLLNGVASTLLLNTNLAGEIEADFAIFEVDENALPLILRDMDPHYIIILNLFRDQLDRYGEVASIAKKWATSLVHEEHINLILNADDPQVAYIGQQLFNQKLVKYFGLNKPGKKAFEHAVDSIYCPRCGEKLIYNGIFYSHLGNWSCPKCQLKRPQLSQEDTPFLPLPGEYNLYNTLAATLLAHELGLSDEQIKRSLQTFQPAFGRQEVIEYNGKRVQLFLAKNPTGFNESLRTIKELGATHILLALNDHIADGTDVSWIWDVDTEILNEFAKHIMITGDRAYDMGLRIKYSQLPQSMYQIQPDFQSSLKISLEKLKDDETLYILPTYTAMLDIRKIITGKKIL